MCIFSANFLYCMDLNIDALIKLTNHAKRHFVDGISLSENIQRTRNIIYKNCLRLTGNSIIVHDIATKEKIEDFIKASDNIKIYVSESFIEEGYILMSCFGDYPETGEIPDNCLLKYDLKDKVLDVDIDVEAQLAFDNVYLIKI